jgi:hypothetical protein
VADLEIRYRMNTPLLYGAISAALLCGAGCARFRHNAKTEPIARPIEFSEFRYEQPRGFTSLEIPLSETRRHEQSRIYLRRAAGGALGNVLLEFDYFRPKLRGTALARRPAPVVVILPASAGGYDAYRRLASALGREFAVVVARRVETPKLVKDNMDGETLDLLFRDSIRDAMQALDWIETRPELDRARIAILGISIGAMRGAILAGVDSRVRASALLLGGSDLPYIIARSKDGAWHNRGISRRREAHRREHGCTAAEFERELRSALTCEPGRYARYADPRADPACFRPL